VLLGDPISPAVANRESIRDDAAQVTGVAKVAEGAGDEKASGRTQPAVFISYASQDVAVANAIVETLEGHGVKCWIAPRDVIPGEFYAGAIVHAIDAAKVIVLVLSENAARSQHVLREVERASAKRHPVVSFRTDLTPIPADLEYFLNTSHWLDASSAGVEHALPRLLDAVRRVGASVTVAAPGDTPVAAKPVAARQPLTPRQGSHRLSRRVLALSVVVALGMGYFAADKLWFSRRTTGERPVASVTPAAIPVAPTVSEKSVAVLPFVDMSQKKDEEYFADGMAEEILDLLAKVPGLHVPARTSSFYFKGKSEDIPTIARRLQVTNVLEGSVRTSGNRVRITAQLVRADNGYHLWSETYDRTLDDVFKVQDEIAGQVVKALKISLGANEVPRAVATNNPEAHAMLLQGEYLFNRETPDDLAKAIDYFEQATRMDPTSATAWTDLSVALTVGWQNGWPLGGRTFQQLRAQAFQAAEKAIAINPQLGPAHEALAEARYWFDWDWAGVDSALENARALDPSATWIAGSLLVQRGHLDEAKQLYEAASQRDPLNSDAYIYLAEIYYAMGQFTDALAAARKGVELGTGGSRTHAALAKMLLANDQPDAALAEAKKESDPGYRAHAVARTYTLIGRKRDADAAIAELERTFAADWAYEIAAVHALRNEPDQAFAWLDRAYHQRDTALIGTPSINIDTDMKSLHTDPRWKVFVHKLKLPE